MEPISLVTNETDWTLSVVVIRRTSFHTPFFESLLSTYVVTVVSLHRLFCRICDGGESGACFLLELGEWLLLVSPLIVSIAEGIFFCFGSCFCDRANSFF